MSLTRWTFVGKVMSLLFNKLSKFSFSSKEQVSINFMAEVTICSDFGAQKSKVCHCFHCFPAHLPWSHGPRCHNLSFENWEDTSCLKLRFERLWQNLIGMQRDGISGKVRRICDWQWSKWNIPLMFKTKESKSTATTTPASGQPPTQETWWKNILLLSLLM